jgi:hypothetical protein
VQQVASRGHVSERRVPAAALDAREDDRPRAHASSSRESSPAGLDFYGNYLLDTPHLNSR